MKISKQDVEHVAVLSRLELSENEKENYTETLNSILEYMELLNRVDTSDVEPTAHVLPLINIFREDKPHEPLDRKMALANAPDEEDGCFKVPRIV
ncbi:MAG: Asp-tRNA(Asn)/Glu-tRNA(Gln) amidotransferase GatCAB subunit C [Firmicutes bacterium HGW-Firmicutes-12]|jgi:aspartyl-tRNA(Asn)/glutamyl-tRNA(Gln) amidotransferase subunit C|nr:MAG: Asp-tRNA(Asn)/Glu-tRNA(Gln) amidotransferase GatCAB subunit C [Firmicutes bacterium HGW-Firmicutes-12]